MTKLVLKEAYRKVGIRTYSLVQCPSCSSTRDVRVDALKDQGSTLCRSCVNRARTKYPQVADKTYHTIGGRVSVLYSSQVKRSKKYGWNLPTYTRDELLDWVVNQPNYEQLFNDWKDSGFSRDSSLSVDRLDDYKPYSFDNIRLVTWEVNNQKGRADKVAGINTKGLTQVRQLDLNGNVIAEFHSTMAAQRQTGVYHSHIHNACRGYRVANGKQKNVLTAGGFKWQFM